MPGLLPHHLSNTAMIPVTSMDLSDRQLQVFSSPQCPGMVITTPPTSDPSPPFDGLAGNSGLPRPQKCTCLEFSLPSEEMAFQVAWDPQKKVKMVHTSVSLCCNSVTHIDVLVMVCQVSVRRSQEVDNLHALCMLELARASQKTFDANLRYRRLCLQEIKVMHTIAIDECEEAASWMHRAESQIGELRHLLHHNGVAIGDSGITLFSSRQDGPENVGDSVSEAGHKGQSFRSPTPSDRDDDDSGACT